MKKLKNLIRILLLCSIATFTFSACGGGGGGGGDSSGGGTTQQPTKTELQGKVLRFTGAYINDIEFVTESTVSVVRNGRAYAGSYTLSKSTETEYALKIQAKWGVNSSVSLSYDGRLVFSNDEKTAGTFHYSETLTGETPASGRYQSFSIVQSSQSQ